MNSPYSSNLLQQPVEADPRRRAPRGPIHSSSVTHVVAQPQQQPMYAPTQPQVSYQQQQPAAPRGSAIGNVALALLVILLGVVALVGGYYATTQGSLTQGEAAVVQDISARDGFRAGRDRGIEAGRTDAVNFSSTTTAMRATLARQQAYNAAFRRGERAGRNSYKAPRYTGGYGGYRAPRYGGGNGYEVASALGQAQNLANVTGAPVDVEVY